MKSHHQEPSTNFLRCKDAEKLYLFQNIGMYTLDNDRPRDKINEDCLIAGELTELPQLSESLCEEALLATYAEMQRSYSKMHAGSTACGTIAWKTEDMLHLVTANAGDSVSLLVITDADGHVLRHTRLSRSTHHLSEKLRYTSGCALRFNRAIGNNQYDTIKDIAFKHSPDIFQDHMQVKAGENAFVVVGSGGITTRIFDAGVAVIVAANQDKNNAFIAEMIAKQARYYGAHDDLSVAVIRVAEKPVTAFVFDGNNCGNAIYMNNHHQLFQVGSNPVSMA